jgi:catechol 2,3-dioxygenase-like lactoylglutathione lyase family enzyme
MGTAVEPLVHTVDVVYLYVSDMDRALRFYRDLLGIPLQGDGDWQEAALAADGGSDLWRQWSFAYDGPAGRHLAQVRATDLDGHTQPEQRTKVFPDGARGWHQIQFSVG